MNDTPSPQGNPGLAQKRALIAAELRAAQNFPLAVLAGLGAALLGAIGWAVLTAETNYKIGYAAIAVGAFVGYAVREAGKGLDVKFAHLGAVCTLLGCLVGDFLATQSIYATHYKQAFFAYLSSTPPPAMLDRFAHGFQGMDVVIYGIGIFAGFRASRKYLVAAPPKPAAAPQPPPPAHGGKQG